jgi:hypothetical protein
MNNQQACDPILEQVILWQDHTNREGYRAELRLITFENGEKCLRLKSGGEVISINYVFPFLEKDEEEWPS